MTLPKGRVQKKLVEFSTKRLAPPPPSGKEIKKNEK